MNRTTQEGSLLAYVMAYLQEELDRYNDPLADASPVIDANSSLDIHNFVKEAIDAYAGGAR